MTKIGAGARLAHSYIRFVLNNESQGTSLARREEARKRVGGGGCGQGKQACGTSLDKYANYSFLSEELKSAPAAVLWPDPGRALYGGATPAQPYAHFHFSAIRENQVEVDQFCPSNPFWCSAPPALSIPPSTIIHIAGGTTHFFSLSPSLVFFL